MDFSQLVMCIVVAMWYSWSTYVRAAPTGSNPTIELRDTKLSEIISVTTAAVRKISSSGNTEAGTQRLELIAPESSSHDEHNNWRDEDFVDYLKSIMKKFCLTMEDDDRTCKEGSSKLSSSEEQFIKAFFGGGRRDEWSVTCAQLVKTRKEGNEHVACVLYVYDRSPMDVIGLTPSNLINR